MLPRVLSNGTDAPVSHIAAAEAQPPQGGKLVESGWTNSSCMAPTASRGQEIPPEVPGPDTEAATLPGLQGGSLEPSVIHPTLLLAEATSLEM